MNRWLVLITVALLCSPLRAAETETVQTDESAASAPPTETVEESVKESTDATPESGSLSLRSKEISEAFKDFQPSEEISADNAVKFPVDI